MLNRVQRVDCILGSDGSNAPLTLIPLPPLGGEETLTEVAPSFLESLPPNGGRGQGEGGARRFPKLDELALTQ